jgi:hypothetical protein
MLDAAEYFRQASLVDGVKLDPRMADAIELICAARRPDGTWLLAGRHPGRVWFEVDAPAGEPSKWLTLLGTARDTRTRLVEHRYAERSALINCREYAA